MFGASDSNTFNREREGESEREREKEGERKRGREREGERGIVKRKKKKLFGVKLKKYCENTFLDIFPSNAWILRRLKVALRVHEF